MIDPAALVDFDAAWIEHELRPFTLTVPAEPGSEFPGAEVTLPATMPAGFRLHLYRVRAERGLDHDLTEEELRISASFLFGPHRLTDWLNQRISEDTLTDAVRRATDEYARREPKRPPKDGDGEGKAAPPDSEGPQT